MATKAEEFIRWYLRFNGYFSIENFVVHAADNPKRIKEGVVPQDTECDLRTRNATCWVFDCPTRKKWLGRSTWQTTPP